MRNKRLKKNHPYRRGDDSAKTAEEILNLVQKTEKEITLSDQTIVGDVYIGTGETEAVRLIAKTARSLYERYPGIHYHIASGTFVQDQLQLLDYLRFCLSFRLYVYWQQEDIPLILH